jgi:hypothetical protein
MICLNLKISQFYRCSCGFKEAPLLMFCYILRTPLFQGIKYFFVNYRFVSECRDMLAMQLIIQGASSR